MRELTTIMSIGRGLTTIEESIERGNNNNEHWERVNNNRGEY